MRILIQRVKKASVSIKGTIHSEILQGLLIFLGIEEADNQDDIDYLCKKIAQIRLFNDSNGVMNLSLQEADASLLVVSQFTLHANTKKGNRPSYIRAAKPEIAIPLYEQFIKTLNKIAQTTVATGVFGANMQVELCNDGPVTIFIDSKMRDF
ncbi:MULTISPECIES: D-aminoacyl-tRNA deacylase [unclassified Capnocytophaga]|jgi:D-tyrosyl-tRNA(Tyr) deacylase|uniref:D-aminoacyl-tRNA deacylase n=1 Tax=unclassified Capnocytophaga TaxID=2640652 RepID=UPI000202ED71|nr:MULTISPECIES: D-aminoacyl-tRNA deacylase [unclassified Capnocytophaga]EGD33129.1 D-tyrosyl-tRNA(Tyr) deacylase [Capnocytophaga sp. oral taxon 338 str. F0234]MEB3005391.1 D-aminoacyl-tRNA deacylase [Capnocytophaga sp. G2]